MPMHTVAGLLKVESQRLVCSIQEGERSIAHCQAALHVHRSTGTAG